MSLNMMLWHAAGVARRPGQSAAETGDQIMSLRAKVVASIAIASSAFLIAPAAQAASKPVQVNGAKLLSALLPASTFGTEWRPALKPWSLGIWHVKAADHAATMNVAKLGLSTVQL